MEFARRATSAFVEWPRELLEFELNRKRLASTVQRNLFDGNAEGWDAYVAGLRAEVPWIGLGLRSLKKKRGRAFLIDGGTPSAPVCEGCRCRQGSGAQWRASQERAAKR